MTQIRSVTRDFAVAHQLGPQDLGGVAAAGFRSVIKNRPEGETPDQPSEGIIQNAAKAAGLAYYALPFQGPPSQDTAMAMAAILTAAKGPVLAYCRTGTRSIMAWAAAQALTGAKSSAELLALAAQAGYDLSGMRGMLESLTPGREADGAK
jgi:uncharacterized protein (TIGR01244 family)